MTHEAIKALSDAELPQVIAWAEEEIRTRTETRRRDAIAKIRALASQAGVSVSIAGVRGRPARKTSPVKPAVPK
jgi:hypothetical protein